MKTGIPRARVPPLDASARRRLEQAVKDGLSIDDIMDRFQVPRDVVRDLRREYGVQPVPSTCHAAQLKRKRRAARRAVERESAHERE